MRLFDNDGIGCFLDAIGHRVERTGDGDEVKMVDLTLRVQPLTPTLAVSLDPDVRAMLFALGGNAEPKPKIKALEFRLTVPNQMITIALTPDGPASFALFDVEITRPRARTEKGVDGFGFVFTASVGPVSAVELEYICAWHTQQRFLTFQPQMPALDFAGQAEPAEDAARQVPRRHPRAAAAANP